MFLLNPQARKVYLDNIERSANNNIGPKWIGSFGICDDKLHCVLDRNFGSIKGNSFQEKLDTLNKCNCCQRHQNNKLTKYQAYEDTQLNIINFNTPYNSKYSLNDPSILYQGNFCNCECRQLSRFICRQYPKKWEERIPIPNEGKPDFRANHNDDPNILGYQYTYNKLDKEIYGNDNISLVTEKSLHEYSNPVNMNENKIYRNLLENRMKFLTKKYHQLIKEEINKLKYDNIFHISFTYLDFVLDSELKYEPQNVLIDWLNEILNKESKFLPFKKEEAALADGFENVSGEKDHFGNLKFNLTSDFFVVRFKCN